MHRSGRTATIVVAASLLLSGFVIPCQAASLGSKVVKGAAIGFLVTKTATPLNKFINGITFRQGLNSSMSTKVVPILSVGEKGYIGGAQVCGPSSLVNKVQAVYQYEKNFSNNNYRAKVLVPSASVNPLKLSRVTKVGVSAIIDVALDGGMRYETVGTGIQVADAARAAAVLIAVKNMGPAINKGLNTLTFSPGYGTKVTPWASIGSKTYLGAAQVSASTKTVGKINAVWQYEGLFSDGRFRIKVLVPTTSSNPLKMKRVDNAGVSAIIDMALSEQKDVNQRDRALSVVDRYLGRAGEDHNEQASKTVPHDNGKHKGWYIGKGNIRKQKALEREKDRD